MKNTVISLLITGTISLIALSVLTPNRPAASAPAAPCAATLSLDMRDLPVAPAAFNHNPYVMTIR